MRKDLRRAHSPNAPVINSRFLEQMSLCFLCSFGHFSLCPFVSPWLFISLSLRLFLSLHLPLSLRTHVRSLNRHGLETNVTSNSLFYVTSNACEKSWMRKNLGNWTVSRCLTTFDMTLGRNFDRTKECHFERMREVLNAKGPCHFERMWEVLNAKGPG